MKKIKKYGNGGRVAPRTPSARERELTPIYVSDPNDPRLKAYNDSTFLYNKNKELLKGMEEKGYKLIQQEKVNLNSRLKNLERSADGEQPSTYVTENMNLKNEGNGFYSLDDYASGIIDRSLPRQYFKSGIMPNGFNVFSENLLNLGFGDKRVAFDYSNVKPVQPVIYKPGTTEAQAFNNGETVNITPNGNFRFGPGGVFYDTPSTPTPTHPTTPYMKKMPMRGMPSTNVSAEPIGVPNASVKDFGRFFLDSKGAWDITPQIPMKADGKEYTKEELNKMGYRYTTNRADYKPSKATINKYKKGGIIKNEFNGNTYDAMGMYGFGGDVLKFAATSPLLPLAASMIPGAGMIAGPAVSMAQQAAQQYAIPKKAEGGTADQTLINVEGGELEVTPSGKIVKEFINKPKHPAYGMDQNGNTMSTVGNIIIPRVGKLGNENFKNGDDITRRSIIRALKYRQSKREGTGKFGFGGETSTLKRESYNQYGPEVVDPNYGETMTTIPSRVNYNTNVNLEPQYTPYNDNTKGMKPLNIPFEETQSQQPQSQSQWSQLTGGQKLNYGLGQAATYGPALYNLGRSIFDKPYQAKMSDYQVNPDVKFDPLKGNAGRADMRNYYNSARTSIRNIGSGSAQLQGQIALANKLFQSTGKFNEDLENRNKLGIFEASRFNKGIQQNNSQMRYQVDMLNEQSRANQRNFGSTAVGQLSDIMQNQRNNNLMMGMLQSNYPGFNINKYTGAGSYNQSTTTTPSTTITPYNPNAVNNTMGFKTMWKNNFGR